MEFERIEYKEGWNPDAIYRSICAFANDFDNIGGGYILVGVAEDEITKTAKRPVKGLTTAALSEIQRKMIGFNNLLQPVFHPHLFIEEIDSEKIIVLWIPGGSSRPYQIPEQITAREKKYFYYIRKYANSVKANIEEQQELISLANQIPFDDRANTQAKVEAISMVRVKNYLSQINSKLAEQVGKLADKDLLRQMELASGPEEHVCPRNVGLMMFADNPERFFPYTRVEIVDFPNGDAGDYEEQDPITGPIPEQINRVLKFLKDKLVKEKVIKLTDKAESLRIASYPYQAIEETLVNAFYHRDYQQREPIEIRIYPNSIVFINYGGPDRSIRLESFNSGQVRNRRYRNRRLGEFLKELELTEGRATGIPTILKTLKDNGSPTPRFNTDDDRSFFEVELFMHPAFFRKPSFTIESDKLIVTTDGVDDILNRILVFERIAHDEITLSIIASIQAGTIAENIKRVDSQANEALGAIDSTIDSTIASTIASIIASIMAESEIKVLTMARQPQGRETLLKHVGLTNQGKNYESYIQPLVEKQWLTMTIPDKPTSPKQKYLTTLKGRLILEILKANKK